MIHMEINIESKRNNPLLNRTEVHFTIDHKGEKTPDRELVRTELAEKLNAKKQNIIVNFINPGFGLSISTGYAKVYNSKEKMEDGERKYLLKRNRQGGAKKEEKNKEEKPEEKKEVEEKSKEKTEEEKSEPAKKEESTESKKEEPQEKKSSDQKKEEQITKDQPEKKDEQNKDEKESNNSNKEEKKE